MKKGFTLIELLAVIVILAVIALITVPMISNVIEESRKGAFKVTCNEIYDAYNEYKINEEINGNNNSQIIFDFNSDRIEPEVINGIKYEPVSKLSLKGELPKFGTYEIKDGKRELVVDNGKYTCVRNENRNDILDGVVADNDLTAPVVRDIILSSTTKSIKVIVDGYEEDGLITKYYYQINNGEVVQSNTNVYVFDNLNTKEEYEIKVYVENKSGLKSEVISKKIETKEISGTTYEESYEETEYEYVTSKVVKVNYDSQEGLNYYIKVDVEVETVNGIIEECGLDTVPGSCTSTSVTVLEPNKWYRTKESTTSLLFKQEGNIYTVVSDGTNTSSENTYEVVKVSDETPTTPEITGGSESWSKEAKIISVSSGSTGAGGVKNYQYCMSTISTECDGTWVDLDSDVTSISVNTNGINYVFFRGVGNNGKISNVSQPQTTMVDTGTPGAPTITGGSGSWSQTAKTISITTESSSVSPISYYQYCISTSTGGCNGTWTNLAAGVKSVNISTNGIRYIYFRGVNTLGVPGTPSNYQTTMVDTDTPGAPTITGGSGSWSQTAKTISVSTESSSVSPISYYQYCISTSTGGCNGTWTNLAAGVKSVSISTNGTRYIYFRGVNALGVPGTPSSYQTTIIDTSNPSVSVSVSGKVATFTLSDNIGTAGYGVNQSTTSEPSYTSYVTTSGTRTWTASAAGNYVVWVKDASGRTGKATFTIASSAFCAYSAGQVVKTFDYTGGVQTFTVPCNGTYKLEVWGAQGGAPTGYSCIGAGGLGGYSVGNITLSKNSTIYAVVGGAGGSQGSAGGYNGGGKAGGVGGSGGGATHIGKTNALLSNTAVANLYIVAGGGGGGGGLFGEYTSGTMYGGSGGGTNGGAAWTGYSNAGGLGGTQTSGGKCQSGEYPSDGNDWAWYYPGSYGVGGSAPGSSYGGGGGGGYYGGGSGNSPNGGAGGGGGSGYIGGVTGGAMSNGQRSGHGYARITLVSISQ